MQETVLGRDEEGFKGVASLDVDRASAGGLCSMTFFPKKVIFAFFKIITMASTISSEVVRSSQRGPLRRRHFQFNFSAAKMASADEVKLSEGQVHLRAEIQRNPRDTGSLRAVRGDFTVDFQTAKVFLSEDFLHCNL